MILIIRLPAVNSMNQQGYIRLVLIIFAIIMGLLMFPIKFPDSKNYPDPQGSLFISRPGVNIPSDKDQIQLDWFLLEKSP